MSDAMDPERTVEKIIYENASISHFGESEVEVDNAAYLAREILAALAPQPSPKSPALDPGTVEALRKAAQRYLLAVERLGDDSGYNHLSFFEAPISKMPNDELGMEALSRWRELNNAGVSLRALLASPAEVIPASSQEAARPRILQDGASK